MKTCKLLFLTLILSFPLHAHTYIGIDVAANTSHWKMKLNNSSLNYSNQLGVSVGVPVQFRISNFLDLGTGVQFANKGTTLIDLFSTYFGKECPWMRIYYLEFPVLLKGKFGSEKTQFNPIAGFSVGYGIAGREYNFVSDGNGQTSYLRHGAVNFKNEELNRLNIQLHFGAGVTFLFPKGNLLVDFQYLHGVSNLSHSSDFQNEDFSVTAHGLELSVGYLFRLGVKKDSDPK